MEELQPGETNTVTIFVDHKGKGGGVVWKNKSLKLRFNSQARCAGFWILHYSAGVVAVAEEDDFNGEVVSIGRILVWSISMQISLHYMREKECIYT